MKKKKLRFTRQFDQMDSGPACVSMAVLRSSDFRNLQYTPIYGTLVPCSCHFIPLCIFKSQRPYRHYWFIEYDVEFTGDWSVLMDDCDTNLAAYDFLSCHVARFGEDNKDGTWWHRGNNCGYPLTMCVKGFNPICRYSGRALECLDRHQRKGYSAHSEVMVTSCLYNHGMRIGDIGGTGEFTPQGYRNKYYVQSVGIPSSMSSQATWQYSLALLNLTYLKSARNCSQRYLALTANLPISMMR